MTRVVIADDEDLMRAGLTELLTADATIEVVGQAASGREAIEQARRLMPDVVLMDVRMPDLDGIAATAEVVRLVPDTRVLTLTTFEQCTCEPRPGGCQRIRVLIRVLQFAHKAGIDSI